MEMITKYFEKEKIEVNYSIENHKILISRHYFDSKGEDSEMIFGIWDDQEWFENHPLDDKTLKSYLKLKSEWESTKFIQEIIDQILADYQKKEKNGNIRVNN